MLGPRLRALVAAHPAATDTVRAALTRRAWLSERGLPLEGRHHEPLEWLGDRVLDLLVAEALWAMHPFADPGALDRARAEACAAPALAAFARRTGLPALLSVGAGEAAQGQHLTDRALSDHVEALLGAAWLAGGLDAARALLPELLDDLPRSLSSAPIGDPMSALTLRVQALWRRSPDESWWEDEHEGPDNARAFRATLTLPDGRRFAGDWIQGKKKQARASAAALALAALADG